MMRRIGTQEEKTVTESATKLKSIQRSIDPAALSEDEPRLHHSEEGFNGMFRTSHNHGVPAGDSAGASANAGAPTSAGAPDHGFGGDHKGEHYELGEHGHHH